VALPQTTVAVHNVVVHVESFTNTVRPSTLTSNWTEVMLLFILHNITTHLSWLLPKVYKFGRASVSVVANVISQPPTKSNFVQTYGKLALPVCLTDV